MTGNSSRSRVVSTGIYEYVEPEMVSIHDMDFEEFAQRFLAHWKEADSYNWRFERVTEAAEKLEAFRAKLGEHAKQASEVAKRGEQPPTKPQEWPSEAANWTDVFNDIRIALKWYGSLQKAIESGRSEEIAVAAYWFGRQVEKIKVRMQEDNARIGRAKRDNARQAGRSRAKSVQEQEARKARICRAYDILSRSNPRLTEKAKVKRLSRELEICERIIWQEKPAIKDAKSTA